MMRVRPALNVTLFGRVMERGVRGAVEGREVGVGGGTSYRLQQSTKRDDVCSIRRSTK